MGRLASAQVSSAMASSTQFTIRGLMAITLAVAVVSALVAPLLRQLEPQQLPRASLYLSVLAVVTLAVAGGSCLRRRQVEKKGSSGISGKGSSDLEEEVLIVSKSVGHSFDDFYLVVDAFEEAGMQWPAAVG